MMRFMLMVKADDDGRPPSPELGAAIGQLTREMIRAGVLLDLGNLLPSAKGARIRVSGGRVSLMDGPFAEAREVVGSYAILQAKTREEAIELGRRFMTVHLHVLGASYEGELEVRQLAEVPPPVSAGSN
jgi:hypothetical protein